MGEKELTSPLSGLSVAVVIRFVYVCVVKWKVEAQGSVGVMQAKRGSVATFLKHRTSFSTLSPFLHSPSMVLCLHVIYKPFVFFSVCR